VKIGIGLITCQAHPDDSRSETERYRDAIEQAVAAERLGFDSVWVSEHHFVDDGYMPSVLPVCAAIAARTSQITIGTAVVLVPFYEPLRLAEDAATVDLISGGRFILGLGQGWRPEEFDAFNVPPQSRARILQDTVTVLRQAWSGGTVSGGDLLSYPNVAVRPKPVASGSIPIWIGATVERSIRRTGRIADGFIAGGGLEQPYTPEEFRDQLSWINQEREALDAPGIFTPCMFLPTYASTGHDPWNEVRDYVHYTYWKYEDMAHARSRTEPSKKPPSLSRERETFLRENGITGSPEAVAEKIRRFAKVAGGEFHYIARLYWPGMPRERQREAMHIFADTIMPMLR